MSRRNTPSLAHRDPILQHVLQGLERLQHELAVRYIPMNDTRYPLWCQPGRSYHESRVLMGRNLPHVRR